MGKCLIVLLLTCSLPKDLSNDDQCPMEVAEVLKWCFPICSVPAAFNGVQTVPVDAPGNSSTE